jgi:anti-sigma B factor antagonist
MARDRQGGGHGGQARMADFRISASEDGAATTLHVAGEIDLAVADDLRQAGLSCLESNDPGLRIDLSDVTFIDSTGLGALVSLRTVAGEHGKTLHLVNVPAEVSRMLELTGLTDTFRVG